MTEIDYMLIADHVHEDLGKQYILGAGIDSMWSLAFPAVRPVGVAFRLLHTPNECGREHRLELIFMDADGQRLMHLDSTYTPATPVAHAPGRLVGVGAHFNFPLQFPTPGDYSLELLVDQSSLKSMTFSAREGSPAAS